MTTTGDKNNESQRIVPLRNPLQPRQQQSHQLQSSPPHRSNSGAQQQQQHRPALLTFISSFFSSHDLSPSAMNLKRRNQRTGPFLQQNWINGVAPLRNSVMGVNLSTPKHLSSGQDDGAPPQKRLRLSSPDPLENDRYPASHDTPESLSALRVEVLKVLHKDSKKVRPLQTTVVEPRDIVTIKGRCRITVSDVSEGFPNILYRCCKNCDIITYKNPVGPHRVARVSLPQPFLVPEESIKVNRHDDVSNDFAQSYRLDVELESVNDGTWPPLDSHDFDIPLGEHGSFSDSAKSRWIFHSEIGGVFGRSKTPVRLTTGHRPDRDSRPTDYLMDVDLRWTAGFRPIAKGSKPCITAIDPDTEPYTTGQLEPIPDDQLNGAGVLNGANGVNGGINGTATTNGMNGLNGLNGINGENGVNGVHAHEDVNGTNGINGHAHEDSSHEPDDDMDGEHTPNRALRTRGVKQQYNLKILSDKAQGKERKPRARAAQTAPAEGRVTYFLPIDQPVCLDYWRCVTCGTFHDSLPLLQLHLQTYHLEYDYALDMTSQGPHFRVTHRNESVASPTRTYQLGKPVKPWHLETYVSGDQSWVTSRLGPDNNEEPARSPSKQATARQLFDSKPSLPPQPTLPPVPRPKKRKITIPETNYPLFDPVSKARLIAGEDLPRPAIDNSWLIQKHREDIGEFSDVTSEEKEYIRNWDSFILKENVTSGTYFPRAWLKFVKEHASWLVAANPRMVEFGKHMGVLVARDVLDDKTIDQAMELFDEARAQLKAKAKEQANGTEDAQPADGTLKQSPRASQIMKGANGCTVCQLPVLGPSLLVCSNKNCSSRLYHAGCIQQTATISPAARAKWLCNECSKSGGSS
ncbi:hypothetical protein LCI18_005505 [Fusarium solani-melongenae]|uniref:Uncharacterized protein n=1 Tax=Fusarium solani subsp. cucurbitae TaxID=2747967 RepID=A0ACD3Z0E4_FUSSC|nr:hypothetical protein LCI18_005505 [Fusarium solani-melongenae]